MDGRKTGDESNDQKCKAKHIEHSLSFDWIP